VSAGLSTAILALAWFAAVNAAASVVALVLSYRFADGVRASAGRARQLLAVRFLPFVAATIVAAGIFAPAHLVLEPPNADERYGVLPLTLAAGGLGLVINALWKYGRVAMASWRLGASLRSQMVRHRDARFVEMPLLPGIALAGILRPRVLIGCRARQMLTPAELDVAIAHELAHQSAWDNVTRVMMQCTPDFFGYTPAAGRIERLWEGEAECLADARAVQGDSGRATSLASALVKVARLAVKPDRAPYAPVWSTFHQSALLETRVRLLVRERPAEDSVESYVKVLSLCIVASIGSAWFVGAPDAMHRLTEAMLALLP
jgi:hypothetical protein